MSDNPENNEIWRKVLSGEVTEVETGRRFFKLLPADPRCRLCNAPFHGAGGQVARLVFRRAPSKVNPNYCSGCYQFLLDNPGGAEVNMTLLFADIRGSTTLAQQMGTSAFSRLINRFYVTATEVFAKSDAWIERLVGDQVIALFLPIMAGHEHARIAIHTAQELLHALGYGSPEGAWLPIGVGVHTGETFMGTVGGENGMQDLTVLGDTANTAARLSSVAAEGEILISEAACASSGYDISHCEARSLQLKGRAQPIEVRVMTVDSVVPAH